MWHKLDFRDILMGVGGEFGFHILEYLVKVGLGDGSFAEAFEFQRLGVTLN